ncbi:hypothetical protein ACFX1Z_022708 [Malus domestica]
MVIQALTDENSSNLDNVDERPEKQSQIIDDEKARKQKEINDWLPITSSRNANWWYAAFHNVNSMVGAGVLGLSFAMSNLEWGPGCVVMVPSWVITLFTLWQMVKMHEMAPSKRFDRYHKLGWTIPAEDP